MFVESLQNIYRQAETIPPSEERNFAYFAYIALAMIHQHHHLEETSLFPSLEPEFKTDVLDEHATFSQGIHDIEEYLKSVLGVEGGKLYGQIVPAPEKTRLPYDGAKLKRLLESFATPLFTHLNHEIDWLAPENIRASGVTIEKLQAAYRAEEEHVQNELDPYSIHVHAMGHVPPYCQFPALPWFVKKILIPWVFWWKHRALWKFLPTWSANGMAVVKT